MSENSNITKGRAIRQNRQGWSSDKDFAQIWRILGNIFSTDESKLRVRYSPNGIAIELVEQRKKERRAKSAEATGYDGPFKVEVSSADPSQINILNTAAEQSPATMPYIPYIFLGNKPQGPSVFPSSVVVTDALSSGIVFARMQAVDDTYDGEGLLEVIEVGYKSRLFTSTDKDDYGFDDTTDLSRIYTVPIATFQTNASADVVNLTQVQYGGIRLQPIEGDLRFNNTTRTLSFRYGYWVSDPSTSGSNRERSITLPAGSGNYGIYWSEQSGESLILGTNRPSAPTKHHFLTNVTYDGTRFTKIEMPRSVHGNFGVFDT